MKTEKEEEEVEDKTKSFRMHPPTHPTNHGDPSHTKNKKHKNTATNTPALTHYDVT